MLPTTPQGWRALTGCFVGLWVVAAAAYTAFARIFGGNEATVSAVVQDSARLWPAVAFVAGFVAGHVFWPVR